MHIILGVPQPDTGPHTIDCQSASILYRFDNGCQVRSTYAFIPDFTLACLGWASTGAIQGLGPIKPRFENRTTRDR